MTVDLSRELQFAQMLVVEAWHEIEGYYGGQFDVAQKPDGPVTTADHASNRLIVQALRSEFPEDCVLSEEGVPINGPPASNGERLWIVDPIDGTNDFIKGTDNFAIQIGLAVETPDGYRPCLGVVYHPPAHEIFWAVQGMGAYSRNAVGRTSRLLVSHRSDPGRGRAVITQNHRTDRFLHMMEKLAPRSTTSMGSMGLKTIWVAAGRADFYLNNARGMCKEWDICAPEAILNEAGGKMTHLETCASICYNKPDPVVEQGVLVTNGNNHDQFRLEILEAEKEVRREARQRGEL